MTNSKKVRHAHGIIDDIIEGYTPTLNDLETLRGFLPELPAQKTLGEILEEVKEVWGATVSSYWPEDAHGSLETWLWELHKQLEGLASTGSKPSQASPRLPEGMRLATHPEYGLCVVSPTTDEDGERRIFYLSTSTEAGADCRWVPVVHLTFLDAEAATPELPEGEQPHPEFLETEADYQDTPNGTIVVYENSLPWVKRGGTWLSAIADAKHSSAEMGTTRREVLRWGFGDE
ncbi:MAG: hypothetical protein HLX50_00710 [Alteromonadaceae bacterium]|nr:hypothetical protein [Alteromonadaceae bacterium]